MGPSVKHVLGVLEWSYVVPEKNLFSKIEFGSGWPPLFWQNTTLFTWFFSETFPKINTKHIIYVSSILHFACLFGRTTKCSEFLAFLDYAAGMESYGIWWRYCIYCIPEIPSVLSKATNVIWQGQLENRWQFWKWRGKYWTVCHGGKLMINFIKTTKSKTGQWYKVGSLFMSTKNSCQLVPLPINWSTSHLIPQLTGP